MSTNDINELIPHLFISNWYTSNNIDILKKYKIKAVITLETFPKPNDIISYYKKNGIDFLFINILDIPEANISKYFNDTYHFINKHILKNENVLVHCRAGISRSSTIILNYLIRKSYEINQVYSCPCELLKTILDYVRSKRNIINPNKGFQKQLLLAAMNYQKNWEKNYDNKVKNIKASIF